jgi:hypothetical protein
VNLLDKIHNTLTIYVKSTTYEAPYYVIYFSRLLVYLGYAQMSPSSHSSLSTPMVVLPSKYEKQTTEKNLQNWSLVHFKFWIFEI